jgi:hypothetical protein
MADCVDCSVPLTESSIACLVNAGITIVGRHYTTDDTCLTLAEARLISAAGLRIIAIYESSAPSRVGNSMEDGEGDWSSAVAIANAVQQPGESLIYIHIPFADPTPYTSLIEYLQGFGAAGPQAPGIYGSAKVCEFGMGQTLSFGAWQTEPQGGFDRYMVRQQASALSLCGVICNTAQLGGSTKVGITNPVDIGSFTVPAA